MSDFSKDIDILTSKEELAKLLYDCACLSGDYLAYLNVLFEPKYNQIVQDAFAPIIFSLQQSLYIELYKLFDNGKDVPNIYKLCKMLDNDLEEKIHYKKISEFNDLVENIRMRRSNIFAHNIHRTCAQEVFDTHPVDTIQPLLKTVVEICLDANKNLIKAYRHDNVNQLAKLLTFIDMQIDCTKVGIGFDVVEVTSNCLFTEKSE